MKKQKQKYILFSRAKEQFDFNGNSLGMGYDRSLYYSKSLGKGKVYRSSYPVPTDKTFNIIDVYEPSVAQTMCDEINRVYNDDFKVIPLPQPLVSL